MCFFWMKNYQEAEREFLASYKNGSTRLMMLITFLDECVLQKEEIERASELFFTASQIREEDFQSVSMLSMTYQRLDNKQKFIQANNEAIKRIKVQLEFDPANLGLFLLER